MQKFYASETDTLTHPNGAIGHRSGVTFDCLGPYAKVRNCPIMLGEVDTGLRRTCYAASYPDTAFSIPACMQYKGKRVRGYFTNNEGGTIFQVVDAFKHLFVVVAA